MTDIEALKSKLKVIYTFYFIIVLLISLVPQLRLLFIVYCSSFIVGSTVYNACTAAHGYTTVDAFHFYILLYIQIFPETFLMFVFFSGWPSWGIPIPIQMAVLYMHVANFLHTHTKVLRGFLLRTNNMRRWR